MQQWQLLINSIITILATPSHLQYKTMSSYAPWQPYIFPLLFAIIMAFT